LATPQRGSASLAQADADAEKMSMDDWYAGP